MSQENTKKCDKSHKIEPKGYKMKGHISIKVDERNECGNFPVTNTITIERDNTFEGVEEWIEAFKKILMAMGFQEDTIKEVFGEENISDKAVEDAAKCL